MTNQTNTYKPCPHRKRCGGCQFQDMPYDEQLRIKHKKLVRLLGDFGYIQPVIGMENPYNYRNKVHAVFNYDKRHDRSYSGTYEKHSHRLVPIHHCQIEDKKASAIVASVTNLLNDFGLPAYNEDSGQGLMRHVLVKRSFTTGEIMVVLITPTRNFPSRKNFLKALLKEHPDITTVIHNYNPEDTSMVLGDREDVIYGKGYIEDELLGYTFKISPQSFYQVNPKQTEILYKTALDFASLTGKELVFDSYCGTGTIGILAAEKAKQVLGVELNRDAVRDAIQNARNNRVKNIYFQCADAGELISAMAADKEQVDVLFMDPPRNGSSREFLDSVIEIGPEKIVYVSCGPESLSRDLSYFFNKTKGYTVRKIQPVDMFPFTDHIETVVLIEKLKRNKGSKTYNKNNKKIYKKDDRKKHSKDNKKTYNRDEIKRTGNNKKSGKRNKNSFGKSIGN